MPDPTDPSADEQDALTHLDLLDPVVVHLNMLRGRIAKLTDAQIRHLHPQLFSGPDPRAVAAQPTLGYDPDCPECKGTGQRDSGGIHPWGEPAMMMCDCDAIPRAVADDPSGIVQQMQEGGDGSLMMADESIFENCTIDLSGADYLAAIRSAGLLYGVYDDGNRVLVDNGRFNAHDLMILSRAAYEKRIEEARRTTEADLRAEVERLTYELKRLREALYDVCFEYDPSDTCQNAMVMRDIARAALYPETDGGQDG